MPVDLKIEDLKADLCAARDELDKWVDKQISSLQSRKANHEDEIVKSNAKFEELVKSEKTLLCVAAELAKRLEGEKVELEALSEEAQQARALAESIPAQVAEAEHAAALQRAELDRETAELQRDARTKDANLNALRGAIALFQKRLGLRFVRGDDVSHLRFIFTNIDHRDPQREFSFLLHNSEDGPIQYTIKEVQPESPSMKPVVDKLHKTNDLRDFVRSIRSEFSKLAQMESGALEG